MEKAYPFGIGRPQQSPRRARLATRFLRMNTVLIRFDPNLLGKPCQFVGLLAEAVGHFRARAADRNDAHLFELAGYLRILQRLADFGFEPATPIETGLPPVVRWCHDYFGDKA